MFVKKIKRKCGVKGCRNVESYAISKMREFGGVIICSDCLKKALEEVNKAEKADCKAENTTPLENPAVNDVDFPPSDKGDNTKGDAEKTKRSKKK